MPIANIVAPRLAVLVHAQNGETDREGGRGCTAVLRSTIVNGLEFDRLLDAMPDAVLVADMESRIVYANASVHALLGWRPESLVGQSLHAIQPERLHAAHDIGFGRYASTGVHTLFDAPIRLTARRFDGTECDVELNLAEISDPSSGRLVLGVLRDLSERVELERHLAILRYLRATTAAAAQLWTRLDPTLVLQTLTDVLVDDFDAALARTWIYEPGANLLRLTASGGLSTQIAGSSREVMDVATHPSKVAAVARSRTPLIRNGLTGDSAFDQAWVKREELRSVACFPLVAGDQLLGVMVSFFRQPIPDEVSETIGHLAALAAAALNDARLVGQERRARAAAEAGRIHFELLARVSERLAGSLNPEVLAQNVADALVPDFADWCVVDLISDSHSLEAVASAHHIPDMADRIRRLRASYPPTEGTPPHAIYRAIDRRTTVHETVSDTDLVERAVDAEHLALLREIGIASHVVVPLVARDRVIGAVSLVRGPERPPFDSDEVATAEDIARRTALAADNARLYRSAQEAIALRDRFLAVASHELRTPLTVVRGNWELLGRRLRSTPKDPEVHRQQVDKSLLHLGQGIEQLRRLVEDLLDVNRLRGGTVQLQRAELDLVALIRDTVAGVQDHDARKRIRLTVPDKPVLGWWDAGKLTQVLYNLVGNGLKYSPPHAAVDVSLDAHGTHVRVQVHDSGIGIAADQLDAIFEPFSRAPNASAQHYPGLGLGLAVSREIVGQLGGRIWAESPGEGRGCTFVVELRRRAVDETDRAEVQA